MAIQLTVCARTPANRHIASYFALMAPGARDSSAFSRSLRNVHFHMMKRDGADRGRPVEANFICLVATVGGRPWISSVGLSTFEALGSSLVSHTRAQCLGKWSKLSVSARPRMLEVLGDEKDGRRDSSQASLCCEGQFRMWSNCSGLSPDG